MLSNLHTVNLLSKHRGWILEGLLRESAASVSASIQINLIASLRRESLNPKFKIQGLQLQRTNSQIYVHHQSLERIRLTKLDEKKRNRLVLTHFDPPEYIPEVIKKTADLWDRILVQNETAKAQLLASTPTLEQNKVIVYSGAIDRSVYFPIQNTKKEEFVLIVGDCKPRKNPALVSEVIRSCPDINFVIHGKNWETFDNFMNSRRFPNLTYKQFSLDKNPELMRNASMLLSLSSNEGGPIPVLEALASGTPVVCTDTGFAPEVVTPKRGLLLREPVEALEVREAILQCRELQLKSTSDLIKGSFTWEDLGVKIYQ